jgi:hypothetical protein
MIRLLVLVAMLSLSGCLEHEARVSAAPVGPDESGVAYFGFTAQPIPSDPPPAAEQRSPLPVSIPVTWYTFRRDARGAILRFDQTVQTPLPWWQRFPCDVVTDFAPVTIPVRTAVVVTPREVALRDPAELKAEAHAHGYAR